VGRVRVPGLTDAAVRCGDLDLGPPEGAGRTGRLPRLPKPLHGALHPAGGVVAGLGSHSDLDAGHGAAVAGAEVDRAAVHADDLHVAIVGEVNQLLKLLGLAVQTVDVG